MCSKSIQNITKIALKSTQKWPFGPPRDDLGTQTDTMTLICTKLIPRVTPKYAIWGPWGTLKVTKSQIIRSKTSLEPGRGEMLEKVGEQGPQNLKKRSRVSSIQQRPTNPLKVTKMWPKGLQHATQMHPKGSKRSSEDPQETNKKQWGKKTPKINPPPSHPGEYWAPLLQTSSLFNRTHATTTSIA